MTSFHWAFILGVQSAPEVGPTCYETPYIYIYIYIHNYIIKQKLLHEGHLTVCFEYSCRSVSGTTVGFRVME